MIIRIYHGFHKKPQDLKLILEIILFTVAIFRIRVFCKKLIYKIIKLHVYNEIYYIQSFKNKIASKIMRKIRIFSYCLHQYWIEFFKNFEVQLDFYIPTQITT